MRYRLHDHPGTGRAWVAVFLACVGGQAAAASLPVADAAKSCVAAPLRKDMWQDLQDGDACRVVAFGRVAGAVPPVFYQLQAYLAAGQVPETATVQGDLSAGGPENDGAGAALLVPSADGRALVTLEGWSGGEAVVGQPRIVQTRQGPILVLPLDAQASSHPQYDTVYRVLHGKWTQVDTDHWIADVKVPKGTLQEHGNAMDWPGLRAFGTFSRPRDHGCCPTGGTYIARLRLDGARLRLVSVRISRGDLPFP
jgi:hypothetical protein